MAELLFWATLAGYAEAAVAYAGALRRPGPLGRAATWGVRAGWLAQTALLVYQAVSAEGFPWATWAASLNLFVWLVVTAYLFWGCRSRYRLLGLAVMPLVVTLFVAARAGGGTRATGATGYSDAFLAVHVGLVLIGFAGLTLGAAMALLYLWQERGLKRHRVAVLRVRAPALVTLESLSARTIALALPLLTLGIAAGLVQLVGDRAAVDALMIVTLATWAIYVSFLALRHGRGWRGRRAAYVAAAGVLPVLAVQFGLALTHFA